LIPDSIWERKSTTRSPSPSPRPSVSPKFVNQRSIFSSPLPGLNINTNTYNR
jgi:hypothetical protein